MRNNVLFITPSAEDAQALSGMLDAVAISVRRAASLEQARRKLEGECFGVVLTEADLTDGSWKDVLQLIRESGRGAELVVTHRFADGRLWADVLDFGAYDLLPQPFACGEVRRILANALHQPPQFRRAAPAA
jgi:DNA-binding NtrC family response regulator